MQQALRTREADLPTRPADDALRTEVLGERSEDYLSAEESGEEEENESEHGENGSGEECEL